MRRVRRDLCDVCGSSGRCMWTCSVCHQEHMTPLTADGFGFDICCECIKETPWPIEKVVP